jgi:hypothetical protein
VGGIVATQANAVGNGDGKPDSAVANANSFSYRMLLNQEIGKKPKNQRIWAARRSSLRAHELDDANTSTKTSSKKNPYP